MLKYVFKLLSTAVALFTLLAYSAPFVNPAYFRWLGYFGTAFPWLLFANLGLVLFWSWQFNRFALYHVGLVLAGWQHVSGFIGLDFKPDRIPEQAVSIATHNLGTLWRGKHVTDELLRKTADEYTIFLQEMGVPDVVCAQETGPRFYELVAQRMEYKHVYNMKKGTVIMSRFPIVASGEIPFGRTLNSSIWVDLLIDSQRIRIYNVHLQSNKVTEDTEKVLEEIEQKQPGSWNNIRSVLGKVGRATRLRVQQAHLLRSHIDSCRYPVIICGDFNDTPTSYVYRLVSTGFTDTFREKGQGFGTTFSGAVPFLRIDYIFTDPFFTAYDCRILKSRFSDHNAVVAEIGWKKSD